jgi:Carboxypeptidase regulatory-like domain/TonB-dependent Receptor Plug Domain
MNWKRFLVVFFAALVLLLPNAGAQSIVTGAVGGIVTDASGAVVAGASVSLKNNSTGGVLTAAANASGAYNFTLLNPGSYTLTVSHEGFKQLVQGVEVLLGQTAQVNIKLEVGTSSQTITVTEQGALLQTEDANITTSFETRQVENVPNPGGDITNIAQTAPGVTMNTTGGGYGNFSAFGLPGTANLFTMNGNDYNDPFDNLNNSGSSNLLLGGNELQEVAVVENGYTGQYGRQAGAQVDYTTKSGGNSFHGDAVYNWTGRALMANDYFNNAFGTPRPFANNNQWAAAIGGPIIKDKLFFFVNTEGLRYILPTSSSLNTPTPEYQAYILSQAPIASSPTATAFYNNMFSIYNSAPGISRATPTLGSCGSSSGYPAFLGDTTVGGQDTACLQNWRNTGANQNKEWLLTGRVDYVLSDKDKVFGRVKFDRGSQPTYTDPINPIFNALSIQPEDDGQLNYTHVFSSNVVNSFVGSVLYYAALFENQNQAAALKVFPGIVAFTDSSQTPIGTTGSDFPFFLFPQGRDVTQWQLVDDLSVTRGNNAFKMGINFRKVDWSDHTAAQLTPYPGLLVPAIGFEQNQITADGLAEQNFAVSTSQPLSNYSFGLYFQDQMRVNSKLTLTLTMRADHNSPGSCKVGCATRLSSPFSTMPHSNDTPFDENFLNGYNTILPHVEDVVFQPRFGFAWTPLGDKTVIRGGVGLFSDLYPVALLNAYTNNFPQVNRFAIPAGTLAFANPVAATDTTSGAYLASFCNAAFASTYAAGGTLADYQTAGGGVCQSAPGSPILANYNDQNNNISNPKFVEWNFEIQRTIGTRTVVSANYVGNKGYDIFLLNPYMNAFDTGAFGGLPTTPIDGRVATVTQLTNNGHSNYNGITLSVQQNVWKGLTGRFNYSYSHALDNISNGGAGEPYQDAATGVSITEQVNPFNPNSQYGSADYDIRQYISGNYVWELPFKSENRLMNAAIGGWLVSGTIYYHTGLPFSITDGAFASTLAGENNNFLTVMGDAIAPIPGHCGAAAIGNAANGGPSLNPCFSSSDLGTPTNFVTNLGRNAFRAPGYFNTDFSLRKNFNLTERMGFTIGANFFNVLNHANFAQPLSNTADGPVFGTILNTITPPTSVFGSFAAGTADARIVQIVGKFTF